MRNQLPAAVVLAGGLLLTGCQGLSKQQQMWLNRGEQAYEQRRFQHAIEQLSLFVNDVPERPETAQALYIRALSHVGAGQRHQARADLTRCLEIAKDVDIRWRALSVLGTMDYEDGQWAAAARHYAAAAEDASKEPPTDVMLFRLGVCFERTGRWDRAWETFERIIAEFPTGSAARDARRRLEIHAKHFAVQCGVFGVRQNAENLVADLRRDGLFAYIRTEPRNRVLMHVVLVGKCAGYEEALRELARVKGYVPRAVLWP